jgi:flagellin-like protein
MDENEEAYHGRNGGISPVIGVILMIAITVIIAGVIAAVVFSMSGIFYYKYDATITVKEVITLEGINGVIDTEGNGYYWNGMTPFEPNKTYTIEYYVQEGNRYIFTRNILDESDYKETLLNAFKCKTDATGVCK